MGLLEPGAVKAARRGSEGAPAQQCAGATRPHAPGTATGQLALGDRPLCADQQRTHSPVLPDLAGDDRRAGHRAGRGHSPYPVLLMDLVPMAVHGATTHRHFRYAAPRPPGTAVDLANGFANS